MKKRKKKNKVVAEIVGEHMVSVCEGRIIRSLSPKPKKPYVAVDILSFLEENSEKPE